MYKGIFFDQDDTLCPAKSKADDEMMDIFEDLLQKCILVIVSGASFQDIEYQIISQLSEKAKRENLILLPTCGARMYVYQSDQWQQKYSMDLLPQQVTHIKNIFHKAMADLSLAPTQSWGEIIEDRGTQVTYSGLGQYAPSEQKRNWDPDKSKRLRIMDAIQDDLKDFDMGIGGSTSIDILPKGIDKAYGVEQVIQLYNFTKNECLYIGDGLFPGGNDYVVKKTGINTIKVENPNDTKKIIKDLLSFL